MTCCILKNIYQKSSVNKSLKFEQTIFKNHAKRTFIIKTTNVGIK